MQVVGVCSNAFEFYPEKEELGRTGWGWRGGRMI
jgi:hypothetical protein